MKKIYPLLISIVFLFVACKESTTQQQPDPINDKYYVIKDGASFVYSLSITDTNGITVNGNRYMNFNGTTNIGGTTYNNQIDTFETFIPFDTLTTTVVTYFIHSNAELYSYFDTTGVSDVLPDSLIHYLTVQDISRLLFYPIKVGQEFPVYTIYYSLLIFGINVIDVDAIVESNENISLLVNNASTDFITYKIKYTFVIRTGSKPEDQTLYSAYGWVVKDLGFVKWEGDSEVFNFLFNENIFPPSTSINMVLKEYQL